VKVIQADNFLTYHHFLTK